MAGKEEARECRRCTYRWFAVRTAMPQKPRWFDETGPALFTDAQTRMARLQGNYSRAAEQHAAWAKCANCGSTQVKTVSSRGFQPTGAVVPTAFPVPDGHAAHGPEHQGISMASLSGYCTACGALRQSGARFCADCGSPLSEAHEQGADDGKTSIAERFREQEGLHPRLAFLKREAAAKMSGDRDELKNLRKSEKERQANLRMRELFAEAKYDVQFAQESKKN